MIRRLLIAVLFVVPISFCSFGQSPNTDLDVTGTVIAVVSGCEIDIVVTRSTVGEIIAEGEIARVKYNGVSTPGRFEPLYMEAFDLNWKLVAGREVYFNVAETPWDDEQRLLAYVYVDPSGYGMVNAMLLASGLAVIDPLLSPNARHAAILIEVAAVAERNCLGVWAAAGKAADS